MHVKVKFLGGAKTVTGSKYLLEIDDFKLLVDCGLFQGLKELRLRNWEEFPIDAKSIDAIVLTHAHIDHSGYLPRIVKEGFEGPIYCTSATASLLNLMLKDAAKLQEEEAHFAKKKGYSKHNSPQPLFDIKDAELAWSMVNPTQYLSEINIAKNVSVNFADAGHILGSSIVTINLKGTSQQKKIVFSGDLGRYDQPMLYDPTAIPETDVLFIESTYGDRVNKATDVEEQLAAIVNEAFENRGCLLIPSFAVGRTQLLLYYFNQLLEKGLIPSCKIYVDSPMAINATYLHKVHRLDHKLSIGKNEQESIFNNSHFNYYRTQESSNSLNAIEHGAVIISASGMMTGGRILHHLFNRLPRKSDTLLFVGYQAEGTRGRKLLEGETKARIFGIEIDVKCSVKEIHGLSAHADQHELMHWASGFKSAPKMTFVVHGEIDSANTLSNKLKSVLAWPNVIVPSYMESYDLFQGI